MKTLNKLHISKFFKRSAKITIPVMLSFFAIAPLALANKTSLEKVVAIVDDDVVLSSELEARVAQILQKIKQSGQQEAPPEQKLRQDILDQLVLENIQLQIAERIGIRIGDAQLTDSISRIAQQNRMSVEQFKAALEGEGQSYNSFREQIRRDMLIQRIQRGNVNQRIQITDQEISNFLASEEGKELTAPQYRMIHTLIPIPSNASDEVADKIKLHSEQLYSKIQSGEDYAQTVQGDKFLQLRAVDLGWRTVKDLPSVISGLASKLEKGETAVPVKSSSGYHLVKLLDKRGDGEVIQQTKVRHILLKESAIRDRAETEIQISAMRQRILDGEAFTDLARKHSEDIGSAAEGGELGWVNPGDLVGIFQETMDIMEVDDISDAFRSQFGWHILQVQERRQTDIIDKLRDNMARNYLHQRKYDDELQAWLQKIRDEAYVDFK